MGLRASPKKKGVHERHTYGPTTIKEARFQGGLSKFPEQLLVEGAQDLIFCILESCLCRLPTKNGFVNFVSQNTFN